MIFSIIIPSFNQEKYIGKTLENVVQLKRLALQKNIKIEILLIDNESNEEVQKIISVYRSQLDFVEIKKDKGQYDAINKGIAQCKGTYWTWINTDDYIDADGFLKVCDRISTQPEIEYIYGSIKYMDENDKYISTVKAEPLYFNRLINQNPGIYQPGSFFRSTLSNKIGKLKNYRCCFDYEYILRSLQNNSVIYQCEFPIANFRYYENSKTGALTPVFIREQLKISSDYGRRIFSFLTMFSYLRLLKHKLFPRK